MSTIATSGIRASSRRQLSPKARKGVLIVHLAGSIGWLGADIGLLVLAVTAMTTGSPGLGHGAVVAAALLATWASGPLALLALLSGILLSLTTRWGLVRYWWTTVSLVLTLAAAAAVNLALGPMLRGFEVSVLAARPDAPVAVAMGSAPAHLFVPPCVAFVLLTFITIINVYKPWGRTRRSR
jgi:hypothetical protein